MLLGFLLLAGDLPVAGQSGPDADWFGALQFGGRDQPIQVSADSFEFDYKQSVLTYRGNVRAQQGDVVVEADQLILILENRRGLQLREVRALGNVRLTEKERSAHAEEAIFDRAKRTATLSGRVELRDGANQMFGERVVVYLDEKRTVIEGGPNQRVRAVLFPPGNVAEP